MRMSTVPDRQHEHGDSLGYPQPSVPYGPGGSYEPHLLAQAVATLVLVVIAVTSAWLFLGAGAPTRIGDTSYQHAHITTVDSTRSPDPQRSAL
jgi:hypothetical protein